MSHATAVRSNPLRDLALAIPADAALAISIVAKFAGAAAAIYYAYDQDTLFPQDHFPRAWTFASLVAAIAVISTAALPTAGRWWVAWFGAFGAGLLIFGGASLSHRPIGLAVVACGVVAWLTYAAAATARGAGAMRLVSGLFMACLFTFLATVAIALTIE